MWTLRSTHITEKKVSNNVIAASEGTDAGCRPTAAASSVALEGGSGRPASGSSASQDAGQDVGTIDRSDDEGSSTSRSASEEVLSCPLIKSLLQATPVVS